MPVARHDDDGGDDSPLILSILNRLKNRLYSIITSAVGLVCLVVGFFFACFLVVIVFCLFFSCFLLGFFAHDPIDYK